MQHIYSNSKGIFMQHNIIMNCSFGYQKKNIIVGIRRKQMSFSVPIFRNTVFLIVTVIITERFVATWSWSFLLSCTSNFINVPLLYCWHWVKSFPKGRPHSTYAQKSPKLDPPPPLYAIVRIWLDLLLCVRTLYIHSPSPPS